MFIDQNSLFTSSRSRYKNSFPVIPFLTILSRLVTNIANLRKFGACFSWFWYRLHLNYIPAHMWPLLKVLWCGHPRLMFYWPWHFEFFEENPADVFARNFFLFESPTWTDVGIPQQYFVFLFVFCVHQNKARRTWNKWKTLRLISLSYFCRNIVMKILRPVFSILSLLFCF